VFGPVSRYCDVFDDIGEFGVLEGKPRFGSWHHALATRPSVRSAVATDYESRLWDFLAARRSYLSSISARA
jgi:glutathione S-transferase